MAKKGVKHKAKKENNSKDVRNRAKALVINPTSTVKLASVDPDTRTPLSISMTRPDGSVVQFPINPPSFNIKTGANSQTVNINSIGDVLLPGKKTVTEFSFSSFFPAQAYSFCRWTPKDPTWYIAALTDAKNNSEIVTAAVTKIGFVMYGQITDFSYGEEDGSGDVSYSITVKEYTNLTTNRAELKKKRVTYKVKKKKEKWYTIARKMTGRAADAKAISQKNGYKGKITKSPKKGKQIKYDVSY